MYKPPSFSFFFSSHFSFSLAHAHAPLETDCASYRSPGGEIRVHVSNHACDFEELENGKPFFLLLSFHRKIPLPSQYIYIYIYKLIGERTRVAVIRVAANAGSIG